MEVHVSGAEGCLVGVGGGQGVCPPLLCLHSVCLPALHPVHVTILHQATPTLTPFPFLYASEEPAGVLKPPKATDRTLLSPRGPQGDGTLGFLLEGTFMTWMRGTELLPGP